MSEPSVVCSGCGLPEIHKACVAHGTEVYMNPDHPAWGKRDEIERLKSPPAAEPVPIGLREQTLSVEATAQLDRLPQCNVTPMDMTDTEALAWIRKKLGLPEDAQMTTGQDTICGRLHVWDSHQHGYNTYITAYKCNDKQGEIARLTVALREAEEDRVRLRLRLLSAAGDDLCRLSQEEIKELSSGVVQIPPKEEFLASCERFHAQIAARDGVLSGCLTLAQLIAENEKLRAKLATLTPSAESD